MSDSFVMLVDATVSAKEATKTWKVVIEQLRGVGLIDGKPNAACVLEGKGYPIGPKASSLYKPGKREVKFWELQTSGVEIKVGRQFNEWALGEACEGFTCPKCQS